jgi:hypothetical protein
LQKLFPLAIIALNIGAAIVYGCKGDLRHAVFWLAAGACNIAVTF